VPVRRRVLRYQLMHLHANLPLIEHVTPQQSTSNPDSLDFH
jgi:hypothetical protein